MDAYSLHARHANRHHIEYGGTGTFPSLIMDPTLCGKLASDVNDGKHFTNFPDY